jgi:hypothetical protein
VPPLLENSTSSPPLPSPAREYVSALDGVPFANAIGPEPAAPTSDEVT